MISPERFVLATLLTLVGGAFAQERAEQSIAALIEQLGDEGTRTAATRKLVARGEPAAVALLRVVFREGQGNRAEALLVLARMRDHAELIAPQLVGLRDLPAEDLPAFFRAVANLVPYTRMDMTQILPTFGQELQNLVVDSEPELGAEIFNEAIRMSGRISGGASIRAHSEIRELVSVLETGRISGTRALAAELLGHRGPSAVSALPALRRALLASHPRVQGIAEVRVIGGRLSPILAEISIDREIHRAAARAMEQIAPGDAAATLAIAHRLLHDPDVDERMDAAMALGRFGEEAAETRALLVEALGDQELRVVREVITALGMLGRAGRDGLPALQELTAHDDPQIAERAKAAIRLIGRGDPGELSLESPVVPWDYEPPATSVESAGG